MKFMASHDEAAVPATSCYDDPALDRAAITQLVHHLQVRLRSCFSGWFHPVAQQPRRPRLRLRPPESRPNPMPVAPSTRSHLDDHLGQAEFALKVSANFDCLKDTPAHEAVRQDALGLTRVALPECSCKRHGRLSPPHQPPSACTRSAMTSSASSRPTDSRTVPSLMPSLARSSAPMRMCVVVAGWVTRLLASPRLLEMSTI